MNKDIVLQALADYSGDLDSLNQTIAVIEQELGPDWTSMIYNELTDLTPEQKERLDHLYNYYAASTAWEEAHGYLSQEAPLIPAEMEERLPVLGHWLSFFGEQGTDLLNELKNKIAQQEHVSADNVTDYLEQENAVPMHESDILESEPDEPDALVVQPEAGAVVQEINPPEPQLEPESELKSEPEPEELVASFDVSEDDLFQINKIKNQIHLLDDLQAWLSARCIQLGNIEIYAYPHYGLVVDMMRQTSKEIKAILAQSELTIVLDKIYEGGVIALENKQKSLENDIEIAVQNRESDVTDVIPENLDMDDVRRTLGRIDTTDEPEYLGPAPDGFEMIDDGPQFDEDELKKQYQEIESKDVAGTSKGAQSIDQAAPENDIKNPSQMPKNSVQRKISFSLKNKPVESPAGGES